MRTYDLPSDVQWDVPHPGKLLGTIAQVRAADGTMKSTANYDNGITVVMILGPSGAKIMTNGDVEIDHKAKTIKITPPAAPPTN